MPHPQSLNIGAYISPRNGGTLATITAAAGQDNTEQNGPAIDRLGYESAVIGILFDTVLTADKTLTLSATLQDSADGTNFDDVAAEFQPGAASGGGTLGAVITATSKGINQYDVELRGLRQYIRVQFKGDLSHSGTDTATMAVVVILGGPQTLPVT